MTLSVQLPSEEQQMLDMAAQRMGRNANDLLRQAVRELYQRLVMTTDSRTPYELGLDLFGAGNLATAPSDPLKRQIWEKLRVKHCRLG